MSLESKIQETQSNMEKIPYECIIGITQYMHLSDISKLIRTSKYFHSLNLFNSLCDNLFFVGNDNLTLDNLVKFVKDNNTSNKSDTFLQITSCKNITIKDIPSLINISNKKIFSYFCHEIELNNLFQYNLSIYPESFVTTNNLTSLTICAPFINDFNVCEIVKYNPNLKTLDLSGNSLISDVSIYIITERLKDLECLSLGNRTIQINTHETIIQLMDINYNTTYGHQ